MMVGKGLRLFVSASVVVALGLLVVPRRMEAQDPVPVEKKKDDAPPPVRAFASTAKAVVPAEAEIPDDPPPHEGAMLDLVHRIGAPDILLVEVLEALPGRPIAGERLVRPDGTISLGFYGDLHVAGLTTVQIKERIIIHLRTYLTDEALGLIAEHDAREDADDPKPVAAPVAPPVTPDMPRLPQEVPIVPGVPDAAPKPDPKPKKTTIVASPSPVRTRLAGLRRQDRPVPPNQSPVDPVREEPSRTYTPVRPETGVRVRPAETDRSEWAESLRQIALIIPPGAEMVPPRDSDRIFVDIASYNSKIYFVLGDVNTPGRLPWTGNETVLDALQFAGGLDPTSDPKNVRLVRPARGTKPAKVYNIDLAAIKDRGDAKANLQLFPNDRLVIGRHPVSDSTVKLNAEAARTNTLLNTALTYAYVLRTFDRLGETGTTKDGAELSIKLNGSTLKINLGDDAPRIDPARRKEALKAFQEYWSKTSRVGGPEEQRVREEMLKLLDK